MLPCHNDPAFIADNITVRREAAGTCLRCPVSELCAELGTGEEFGVYAGTLENDPARVLFRQENRRAFLTGRRCRNGHDLGTEEEPTVNRVPLGPGVLPDSANLPGVGCQRCTDLRDRMAFYAEGLEAVPA